MNKCKRYPDCDCYNNWVSPALELVPEKEAELFAEIMQEIENFCDESKFIEFETIMPFIQNYKDVLPVQLVKLFFDCLITRLDFHYKWKMPRPTDIKKIEINLPKLFVQPDKLNPDNLCNKKYQEPMGIEEFLAITSRIPSEFEIYDKNLKTFEGLEDYIIKNVSEDRKADLEKLDRLKSNLLGWQTILLKLKGKPLHSLPDLEEKQQTSIIRLEAIIEAALKDLDFRIYRKRALPKEDNQLLPVNKDNTDLNPPIDPLSVINPLLHKLFFEKESKAKNKDNKWDSKIKCAAFCELLWNNKYLGEKKERIKQCNDFAIGRYGIDISVQLDKTREPDREKHKTLLAYIFK